MPEWGNALIRVALPFAIVAWLVWLSFRYSKPKAVTDGPEDEPYRAYTRGFDLELLAGEVVSHLPTASPDGGRGHLGSASEWKRAVADAEAMLEKRRFSLNSEAALARLREVSIGIVPQDLMVTILIDQSGSMKGPSIAAAMTTATLLTDLLERFGARSEILGFSTAGWRGGHPRSEWLEAGRPKRPGRLCALMHVIYKIPDEGRFSVEARNVMVHPDVLRENVDGEAILWASGRLRARPEPDKMLIVISDGAPVDDSTLEANGPSYLFRHFMNVVREQEADEQVTIGGVGISHDVEACYWLAETALTPADVPDASLRLLERMLSERAGFRPSPE